MNSIPVLRSKLTMPELSDRFLLTDRLKWLHNSMNTCSAVTVSAPAGYGKTTLAVSYFSHQTAEPCRVCWYRLDPSDANPSVFIAHLAETVFPSHRDEFTEFRQALTKRADIFFQPHLAIAILCRQMWAMQGRDDCTRTYIVLDDFHNVAQIEDIGDMIRYLLDNLPPSWAMVILSRAHHYVFSEKQKLEKEIKEINASDLAFDHEEIEDLMLKLGQSPPNRKLTDAIAKTTEGWIAGIIILWQAVKSMELDTATLESHRLINNDALFRYMSLEVLKSVPGETQDALARLAILHDFSEAEALGILAIDNIGLLMEQCLGFGMFVQRIPEVLVIYRFHSLFREFLLYILARRYTDEQIAELHLMAARYYMQEGIFGRAAEHLSKCGNSAAAIDLVTDAGFNKFMIGETGQLKMWLDALPEDAIRDNPVLLMFKAQLMPNSEQPEVIETLKQVLHLSLQGDNLPLYYDAASVLIYIYMCSNDMKGLREMTAGFPSELPDDPAELRYMAVIIYMVRFIAEDRFDAAEAQSESISYTNLPEDSQWLYLILSCITYYCLGKLEQAQRCMESALMLNKFKNIEPSRGFILLFLSLVLALKKEKEHLPSYIGEIIAIGEKYDYEYLAGHGRRLAALEHYLSFDVPAAEEMLDQAAIHFLHINNKAMASACRLLQCLWAIKPAAATPDLEDARNNLTLIGKASPGMMVYEISLSILGAIARESGDFHLAEGCLLTSIKSAQARKSYQVLCGACFHIARLYYAQGDAEQGYRYLQQAMDLAADHGYVMFWDVHIPTVVEISLRSIRYGYRTGYAEDLLSRFCSDKTVKYLSARIKSLDENRITAFCSGFVFRYPGQASEELYFVKASLFGKTEISVNGVPIPDSEWKTKKVKGLLEYLLLSSGTAVSKEMLAEIFWPDSDSKSALASQRTALYHLRKTLTKYNADVAGNNAFIYETPKGLQIRNNETLELDIHEFLRLYQAASGLNSSASQAEQNQADLLEKMMGVYKGDLLAGIDYGDLLVQERERFKSIFLEACQKLSLIYLERSDLSLAEEILKRALATDPYHESLCLQLLNLYVSQGRRSKAVKLYYSFKKRLEQDLDIKVDKRLTEAIRQV